METGLRIVAWRGSPQARQKALDVFHDSFLTLVASLYPRLELAPHRLSSPKARAFVNRLLGTIEVWVATDNDLVARAGELRTAFDLAPSPHVC